MIGCPLYEREWSLPRWFTCLYSQGIDMGEVKLVFALTDGEDKTRDVLEEHRENFKDIIIIECNDLPAYRDRDQKRFFPLVTLRNKIIEILRVEQPDFYFSYDSDIIIPDETIRTLIEDNKQIVSPYVDLVPPAGIPNCATRRPNNSTGFRRYKPYETFYPIGQLYRVDTVFAVFIMKKEVYMNCDYYWHPGGEDYGWALEIMSKGYESWMDSRLVCTHLYRKDC